MGEYFEQVIKPKLGLDIFLRMDPETFERCHNCADLPQKVQKWNGLRSWSNGRYRSANQCDLFCRKTDVLLDQSKQKVDMTLSEGNRGQYTPEVTGITCIDDFMQPLSKRGESISAFNWGTARGLGKLAGYMANRGTLAGE